MPIIPAGAGAAVASAAAGAAVTAGVGLVASSIAGGKQAAGANAAAGLSEKQAAQNRADLLPYNTTGQKALGQIDNGLIDYGTSDKTYIDQANAYLGGAQGVYNTAASQYNQARDQGQHLYGLTAYTDAQNLGNQLATFGQAGLENTPGYQFALQNGLQAVHNGYAARGLGVSGAAMKGAAAYATGLADQTYQQQYGNAQQRYANAMGNAGAVNNAYQQQFANSIASADKTANIGNAFAQLGTQSLNVNTGMQGNLQNAYNRLLSTAGLGENAASSTGTTGATLTNQAGQGLIAAGKADAAGIVGGGNAITGAINSGFSNYNQLQGYQNGLGGGQNIATGNAITQATTPVGYGPYVGAPNPY